MGVVNMDVMARTFHGIILCYNIANNKVLRSHDTTCSLCWGNWQRLKEATVLRENSMLACWFLSKSPSE